jgi:long-chain acyl-CoA synthetase
MVMRGYHKNEKANAEVFFYRHPDTLETMSHEQYLSNPCSRYKRYFRTGDMGRLVEGKFLKITGRIKEQYKLVNGKYVVPSPLEDVLNRFIAIQQCFLYGNNREHNVLLVVPNYPELKNYFQQPDHHHPAFVSALEEIMVSVLNHDQDKLQTLVGTLFTNKDFIHLITDGIVRQSTTLKSFERPLKWVPIAMPFSVENQMLTPKMSLRRNNIHATYENLIDDLYDVKKNVGHHIQHSLNSLDRD